MLVRNCRSGLLDGGSGGRTTVDKDGGKRDNERGGFRVRDEREQESGSKKLPEGRTQTNGVYKKNFQEETIANES